MFQPFAQLKRPDVGEHWVYFVEFWPSIIGPPVFAAVGGRRCTICEISNNNATLSIQRAFCDEDEKEDFYCCAFTTLEKDSIPLLCLGGESGTIKVMEVGSARLHTILYGHGGAVYDMKIHPLHPDILFTCSKDESIRMWSISQRKCLVVFAGDEGHRDSVLSISIHANSKWLASCGLDNSVRVWELDCDAVNTRLQEQQRAKFIQFPAFVTRRVHTDYVDSVEWIGDLLVTKSIESKLVLWKPDVRRRKDAVVVCRSYLYETGKQWFARFGVNAECTLLCIGGDRGGLSLFELSSSPASATVKPVQRLATPNTTKQIRSVKFSPNSEYIVAGGDDGILWCYKKQG